MTDQLNPHILLRIVSLCLQRGQPGCSLTGPLNHVGELLFHTPEVEHTAN